MVTTGAASPGGRAHACSDSASPAARARAGKPGKEVATLATSSISMGSRAMQARDREGHRDAVIAVTVDAPAAHRAPP